MPKIPVTFDDVKTLAERSKTKTLGDSDLIAVEIAQEIKGLTKEDALETLGINDLDGRVQYLEETALNNKADKDTDAVVGNFAYFDAEGNPVDSGKKDADYEDADATILKEADVVDSLESTSTTAPLSANQGKVLNDAIGEVEGRVEDAEDDITAIKGVGYTEGTLKSHEDRLGTLEGADTIEGSVAKTVKDAVDPIIEDVSDHETRLDTLEADSATEVLKNIKDNAKDATYDNSTSGLTAETLGGAIDEVEGRVDTVEGEIDDLQTAETDIKGNGWTDENLVDHEGRITQNESDIVALKGTGWTTETVKQNADDIATKESIENVNTLKGTGWTDETVKGNAEDIATLNGDDATEGSVLKSIKDNAENATFTPAVASGIESETLKEAVNELGSDVSDHETRIEALEETGGPPGPQGDDGLSAYEVAVEEGFVGDETAWLASLKGADGDDGLSAYEIYVETTSDSPVKTEEQWLASLKGADGKSAYEYAEEEGYEGTEGEFAEALADVENKIDKSKIVTAWNSPKDDEVPSAKLVHESLNGGGGAPSDYIIIGLREFHSADDYDVAWEDIITDQPTWYNFWESFSYGDYHMKTFKFKRGNYRVPANVYYETGVNGHLIFPDSFFASFEGAGSLTEIKVLPPAGGIVFSLNRMCTLKNMIISNSGMATYGVLSIYSEEGTPVYIENVIIKDMVGAGIACVERASNVVIKNCTTINCGSAVAGQQAAGIAVAKLTSNTPTNITIDGCTVIGGAYAGIGIVNAEDCKVVNCHVEDYGKIGAVAIGGERNIFANNTIIRDTQADPQASEFGILLNETDRAIVVGNIVENGHIMDNNSNNCLVENNIGDVL